MTLMSLLISEVEKAGKNPKRVLKDDKANDRKSLEAGEGKYFADKVPAYLNQQMGFSTLIDSVSGLLVKKGPDFPLKRESEALDISAEYYRVMSMVPGPGLGSGDPAFGSIREVALITRSLSSRVSHTLVMQAGIEEAANTGVWSSKKNRHSESGTPR